MSEVVHVGSTEKPSIPFILFHLVFLMSMGADTMIPSPLPIYYYTIPF